MWFTMSLWALELKTNVNKFVISSHTALRLAKQVLKSYTQVICEYQLRTLPNKKLVLQRIMVKTA